MSYTDAEFSFVDSEIDYVNHIFSKEFSYSNVVNRFFFNRISKIASDNVNYGRNSVE